MKIQAEKASFILTIALALILNGCASYTTVQIKDFVNGLERNLGKLDKATIPQLLAKDQQSKEHVKKFIEKKQCQQHTNDPLIILAFGHPVELTIDASVDKNSGLVLIGSKWTFGVTAKTGTSATWKLIPVPLSSIPTIALEKYLDKATKWKDFLPEKERENIYKDAKKQREELQNVIDGLINSYPTIDCE